jgi:biotin synthase
MIPIDRNNATIEELAALLRLEDFRAVYEEADRIREEAVGNVVHIRAILEFSNYCRRACRYCGLNCRNPKLPRYRMEPEEMVSSAQEAAKAGYRTLVMQSGEDPWYTPDLLGEIVRTIKQSTGMVITLSCGEMNREDYAYLKECGADRYLLKHETADSEIYAALHPDSSLDKRVECLKNLKSLGFETGSGFMIGLPGQTKETIAKDLLLLREIGCDMAGIGPFIPHPDTPLRDQQHGSSELCKRAVALARILLPHANLPATTSLGVLNGKEKDDVFSCGANVVMRKVTPTAYKRLYEIYPAHLTDTDVLADRRILEEQIRQLGRIPQ